VDGVTWTQWATTKREEARRLHTANYRAWIEAGAMPLPVFGAQQGVQFSE
jgi:hypothetical protein